MQLNKLFMMTLIGSIPMWLPAQNKLSLDGTWEILFDDDNRGRDARWMHAEVFGKQTDIQEIEVPAAWETIRTDYEGVAFFRKTFEMPASWEGKVIRVYFGAVNYLAEVWLNDEVVGYHEGGFTPFEFRVDEMARVGEENTLTLRVVGPLFLSEKSIDGMKALEMPQWRGGISGGIWQSVYLEATDHLYIDDVFIQPRLDDNTILVQLTVEHTGIENVDAALEFQISEAENGDKTVAQQQSSWSLHPGINQKTVKLDIPEARYWSPDQPNLYHADIKVSTGQNHLHHWQGKFGMRSLTIRDKDFYLNGERIYIKAAFFEGLYPNGICSPDSEAMARQEIRLAKEAGFNMIRPWRHPPTPMWLDLADEMGVLVVGSPALECMQLPFSTPYLPGRVENEVRQAILRDRNRACIVQWELFNELHRPVLKQLMRPMANLARSLDPTRLILDESGGWAFGANMYLPGRYVPTKFNDIHNYAGSFINRDKYEGYLSIGMTEEEKQAHGYSGPTPGRNVVPGLMSYVSELGYGSLPDLTTINPQFAKAGNPLTPAYRYHHRLAKEQEQLLQESGFGELYPDMQAFYLDQQHIHGSANKRMIEAVRSNPEVDGYCIHALVAGDWILGAGLLDLFRNPKSYAYEATRAANQSRIVSIRSSSRNIYAEEGTVLSVTGINDLEKCAANLNVRVLSTKNKVVYEESRQLDWDTGISRLFEADLPTAKWKGSYRVQVMITGAGGDIVAENDYSIDVFRSRDLRMPGNTVAILGSAEKLQAFLTERSVQTVPYSSGLSTAIPVLVPDQAEEAAVTEMNAFMKRGGSVIFLGGLPESSDTSYPLRAKVHPAQGLWTCMPHLVQDHPIFAGLPSGGPMRDVYENVWARHTLRDLVVIDGQISKTVVGTIAFDWFSKEHKMHYTGPGKSWWGSDVALVQMGSGRAVLSQLQIVPHLGKDPVADKILGNMIRFVQK